MLFYAYKSKHKRRAPRRRRAKRAPARRRRIPKALRPEVKSQYHVQATKIINPKCMAYSDILQPFPTIVQGTAQNNRIGNRINGLTLRIAGLLTQKFVNTTGMKTTRIGVRMIVCNPRKFPNGKNAAMSSQAGQWLPKVVDMGNTGGLLDGTVSRFYAPLNKELLNVWADKKYILTCPYVPDESGSDERQEAGGLWHSVKPFYFRFKFGRQIRYMDGTEGHPESRTPVILVTWCCLNGETLNNNEQELSLSYRSDFYYTDG